MSKYISHGTYGCVMRPNTPCSKSAGPDSNMVSKLFRINKEAISEHKMHKQVHDIDPQGVFTLKLHEMCKVSPHIYSELNKCTNWSQVEKQRDKIGQIVYEYGGTSLPIAARTVEPAILFRQFKSLFKGLIILQNRNWAHLDIKPDNIVYNSDTKKMTMIDFGLTSRMTDVYTKKNNYLHEYIYPYYPPEFKIVLPHSSHMFLVSFEAIMDWQRWRTVLASVGRLDDWDKKAKHFHGQIVKMPPPGLFIAEKVDMYSLGIAMLEAIVVSCSVFKFDKDLLGKLVDLIGGMTAPNSTERFTPREAYVAFKKIWVKEVITSPKRSNPVPVVLEHVASPKPKPKTKSVVVSKSIKEKQPCPEGKVRNPATGRCITKKAKGSKKPCPEGKVRNPLTGRCITKASSKKPCPEGKVRNPLTGRCKASKKHACPKGKVRNPVTGRCKKIIL